MARGCQPKPIGATPILPHHHHPHHHHPHHHHSHDPQHPHHYHHSLLPLLILAMLGSLLCHPAAAADTEGPAFVADGTPDHGTTGDPLTFRVTVEDPSGLFAVQLRYWFDSGPEIVTPMAPEDATGLNWTFTTSLMRTAKTLHYVFRAQDTSGNWAETQPRHASIADNDPPELLSDTSPPSASPGEAYVFSIDLSDNSAVARAWVLYRLDGGNPFNLSLQAGHPMTARLLVSASGVLSITYHIESVDPAGNGYRGPERTVPVVRDTSPPVFGRDSSPGEGATGAPYRFTVEVSDDTALAEVRAVYRFGDGSSQNRSLSGAGVCTLDVELPLGSLAPLNYSFFAQDGAGNWARTHWRVVAIVDTVGPVAEAGPDLSAPRGGPVRLNGSYSHDNIGIEGYTWTVMVGGRLQTSQLASPTFELTDPGVYTVSLVVRDASGNEGQDEVNVTVADPGGGGGAGPTLRVEGPSWQPSALLAIAVSASVALGYPLVRLRRGRRRGGRATAARGTGPRSTSRRS